MKSHSFIIKSPQGLHARPCTTLAAAAKKFDSTVTMTFNGNCFDVCNPISLMTACVGCNDEIILSVSGNDEDKAMEEFIRIMNEELAE
ncbi:MULTISPECIES: HPr family phosphocarrier protein [Anaerostipes]|uniref:HPr family phosphocarrier protein n=1 Tax=Anaerostipes TaxID=207244 RepID=UPI000951A454|nr:MULTISPECIES: HPr family phosphocarrier protein [Anaerostipes]MCI5622728.1 HPr family phosphocarrier protein [Anaerostipes sp.]MDY2726251.1 HPr family phosphocarrier protein [Anaerostipes faecalis]OLR59896.1 hypothetical protein BHF70_09895 [Anaerostipes sp. 494a]